MDETKILKECRDKYKMGRLKYSLLYGSVYAVLMYAVLGLSDVLFFKSKNNYFSLDDLNVLSFFTALALSIFMHATYFWWENEKRYKKLIEDNRIRC
jgi:hypothetical protein